MHLTAGAEVTCKTREKGAILMSTIKRQGGCPCGSLRYELTGEPLFVHACHCTLCQAQSGSAFGLTMFVEEFNVRMIQGRPVSRETVADSGNVRTSYFCASCGATMWGKTPMRPGLVGLRPGSLDDTSWVKPRAHIWIKSKQPWLQLPKDVPAFEKAYDAAKVWPKESLDRMKVAGS